MRAARACDALVALAAARRARLDVDARGEARLYLLEGVGDAADAARSAAAVARLRAETAALLRWALARQRAALLSDDAALDVDWLYDAVRRTAADGDAFCAGALADTVASAAASLPVSLRPYQQRAVAWMLSRELGVADDSAAHSHVDELWVPWSSSDMALDCASQAMEDDTADDHLWGDNACVNVVTGEVLFGVSCPPRDGHELERPGAGGGMLCDEMGLGKTVEVLALVAANPRTDVPLVRPPQLYERKNRDRVSCVECSDWVQFDTDERASIVAGASPQLYSFDPFSAKVHSDWIVCRECCCVAHRLCSGILDSSSSVQRGYVCTKCCEKCSVLVQHGNLHKSRATLIVAPPMLLDQWRSELARHGPPGLNVVVFEGLKAACGYVPLYRMLNADIVLTTYAALRTDVAVVQHMRSHRTMRFKRKYSVPPTPLITVEWWRVCLDEAQMVSSNASACTQMAMELSCSFRWCVTGTPIRKCVDELYSYLNFLRIGPVGVRRWWEHGLIIPAKGGFTTDIARLRNVLRAVMWRTNKADVEGTELCLPPQSTEVAHIDFGAVEKYFYSEVLALSRQNLRDQERSVGRDTGAHTHESLERLRQACCHPQVGAAARRMLHSHRRASVHRLRSSIAKRSGTQSKTLSNAASSAQLRAENPLTMQEVLGSLVERARCECEDAQRDFAASSNGLAGTLLLLGGNSNLLAAVKVYRGVLDCRERNRSLFDLDRVQLLHVLHNLIHCLKSAQQKMAALPKSSQERTALLDSSCRRPGERDMEGEIESIRQHYIRETRARVHGAMFEFRRVREEVSSLGRRAEILQNSYTGALVGMSKVPKPSALSSSSRTPWWSLAFGMVLENGDPEIFLERVVHTLVEQQHYARAGEDLSAGNSLALKLHSVGRVETVVTEAVEQLNQARSALITGLESLPGAVDPTDDDVRLSGHCTKCRGFDAQGAECAHCHAEHLLIDYESVLYNTTGRKETAQKRDLFRQAGGQISLVVNRAMRHRDPPQAPATAYRRRSELEVVMRSLASVVRRFGDQQTRDCMQAWIDMLDKMKHELDVCRTAFDAQKNLLAELDELEQATQRITVVSDSTDVKSLSVHEQMFTVKHSMLPQLRERFEAERASGDHELQAKKGDLIYLSSLGTCSDQGAGGSADEIAPGPARQCPICLTEFGEKMALYECAHAFCADCVTFLIRRAGSKAGLSLLCPVCRRRSQVDEIKFVIPETRAAADSTIEGASLNNVTPSQKNDTGGEHDHASQVVDEEDVEISDVFCFPRSAGNEESAPRLQVGEKRSTFLRDDVAVDGAHLSSKTTAIVRVLKAIATADPDAKTLVFSQWKEVLAIVSSALRSNNIQHVWLESSPSRKRTRNGQLASSLEKFKTSAILNVMLVLRRTGAAGLNIVEATHVILVEPWLNPALEAQAVSRVHRLSQTKPTFVHRFLINHTIEDRIRMIAAGKVGSVHSSSAEDVSTDEVHTLLA